VDVETTGLNPIVDQLLLIQIGLPDKVFVFDCRGLGDDLRYLAPILSKKSICKLGQNLAFDWGFLEANGLPLRGPLLDTMLGARLINLGLRHKNDLGSLVQRYLALRLEDKKELQKSFIGHVGPFTEEQLEYAARDVALLFPLYEKLRWKLKQEDLHHIFKLECRCLPAFASMIYNGFLLDVEYYERLLIDRRAACDEVEKEVIAHFEELGVLDQYKNPETGEVIINPASYGRGKNKIKGFNLRSPAQLAPVLRAGGVPVTGSLDQNVLAFLAPDYPIVRQYLRYKHAATECSQIEKLIGHAKNYPDHRIRASYRQLGTDTGRSSCSGPNLQQVNSGKEHRQGFKAALGHKLVIADYSQLELRIAAECSGEERMAHAYQENADLHLRTASLMLNKPEKDIDKSARTSAKIINFGALYGAGAKTIQKQAVAQYGVYIPLKEAEEKLGQWRRAYPQLIGWQKTQGNRAELNVKTLMGRRRLLVPGDTDRFTVRLNTQVQGTGGDCMKAALAMLWESYLEPNPYIKLVACIHDECVLEVPEDCVEDAITILKQCMEAAAYEVCITNVPIVANAGWGDNWSAK
jgi:DNA polymerase I-like protein with 3'-5' exonuclease and polymerase domains